MSSDIVIEARDLGKAFHLYRRPQDRLRQILSPKARHFEEFWALRHLDLTVRRGETLGIIGRNGAGKSTLLQLICGTLKPSAGSVTVSGRIAAMLELGAGFNAEFTGRENVYLNASVLGLSRVEIQARFARIEAFAGLGPYIDQPVKRYSSGMYARLAFAVCAHVDADILVVDEILAVGDFEFQQKCMRFLHDFRRRGTLLFVSHDDAAVARLCNHALLLDRGAAREYGDAREITRRYRALQSEQMTDGAGSFRIEGSLKPVLAPPLAQRQSHDPARDFLFDPEMPGPAQGGGALLEAGFYDGNGAPLGVAAGGEEVRLQVRWRAEQAIGRPVVAFALRDRLAQILFGDDTASDAPTPPPAMTQGQEAEAIFRFRLPYMASGSYAVEIFLFDGEVLLDNRHDATVLHMQSRHISGGLANLAMREVSLTLDHIPEPAPEG
jgi:lipopolysaccharide transport system ATP-binding protein